MTRKKILASPYPSARLNKKTHAKLEKLKEKEKRSGVTILEMAVDLYEKRSTRQYARQALLT